MGETAAMAELLHLERRDDGVAVVTLANGKVNALSGALLRRAPRGRRRADGRPARRRRRSPAASGSSPPAPTSPSSAGPTRPARSRPASTTRSTRSPRIPRFVIAAVSGYALGGGCELALACDYRIAGPRAVFGQPEILLGIIPGGGGTQRLARLVGPSRAKELCLTGRQVKVDEAVRIGLADEVVDDDPTERALELAAEVARGPLVAQALTKRVIDAGLSTARSPTAWRSSGRRSSRCSTPTTAAPASPASSSTVPARRRSPAAEPDLSFRTGPIGPEVEGQNGVSGSPGRCRGRRSTGASCRRRPRWRRRGGPGCAG